LGARDILLGEASIVLAGGTENMSQAPYAVRDIRFGTKLVRFLAAWAGPLAVLFRCSPRSGQGTNPVMEDTLWAGLTDAYNNVRLPAWRAALRRASTHVPTRVGSRRPQWA
jgi:acetyl-CoA acyltransferase 2